jgi:hypothetical protein
MRRITKDGLQINTANKHMGMVSRMLKRVSAASELDSGDLLGAESRAP